MSTQYNKTIATLKTVEHDTKLLDAQKIKINPGSSDINERKDIVEFINERIGETLAETGGDVISAHSTAIATNTSNISSNTQDIKILQHYTSQLLNESLTQFTEFKTEDSLKKVNEVIRNAHSFRLDYEHVPQGIISEISIKNPESVPTLSNGEVSSANTEVYLIVKIYKGDNISFPQLKNIVISKNKAKNNIENGEYTTWTFDNLLSPGPGEWMRVHCSTTPTTNHYTNTYITLPLNATSYHKNCGFNGDGTAWNDGRFYDPSFESSPMGKLSLSAPSKGLALIKFNGIFYKNIVSEKFVLPENSIYYSEYDTKTTTFDTSLESPGIANGSSVSFSGDHTPDGLIKEIQIYNPSTGAANTTTSNDLYIIAKVYDIISDNKCKLAYSASSNNPARSNTGDYGTTSWYFDGFVAAGKNQFLKLYPSSDGITVDTTKYIRIHLDETHYHKGCFVGGDTIVNGTYDDTTYNNQNKWLGFVKFFGDFY